MIDRGKRAIAGVLVSVTDYEAVVERVAGAARQKQPLGVSALAVHGVMTGAMDSEHCHRLNRLDIVVPDGQPVRWALRLLHREPLPDRVYGPNLMLKIVERAARDGLSIFLFGSSADVLSRLSENLRRRHPQLRISGMQSSQFRRGSDAESAALRQAIAASGADIVFVGIGCPRQEVFVYENVRDLSRPVVAVGAAYDFHAGTVPQAPAWMQASGLEWLFRLVQEPRRLWRRYILLNPYYCALVLGQLLGILRQGFPGAREPVGRQNFI